MTNVKAEVELLAVPEAERDDVYQFSDHAGPSFYSMRAAMRADAGDEGSVGSGRV